MGTFVEIGFLEAGAGDVEIISEAYIYAEELEKVFNIHDRDSEISSLNLNPHRKNLNPSLEEALRWALQIYELSEKAFIPFKPNSTHWDLNGIAKGFVVDKLVEFLTKRNAALAGVVNAGGDMRFFNCEDREVTLRLGSVDKPIFRTIMPNRNAMASSSLARSVQDPLSSTRYQNKLRAGINTNDTVVVMADTCAVSDALTKVGLFATPERIQACARELSAEIILFNDQGDPVEVFS